MFSGYKMHLNKSFYEKDQTVKFTTIFVLYTLGVDSAKRKLKRTLRFLNIEGDNPAEKKFLKKTKNTPGIHKSSEKSPLMGFTKIRNYLRDNFMDRVKWTNTYTHIEERKTFRDRLIFFRTIRQG